MIFFEDLIPKKTGADPAQGSNPFADLLPAAPKADRLDAKPLTWKETADDYANSFGSGVARGAIQIAGLPGDLREIAGNAATWGANKLGFDGQMAGDVTRAAIRGIPGMAWAPTTNQIMPEGLKYDSKTEVGPYLGTAGEMATNALAPGGVIRRAAMVAAPAALSEGLGQATKGTAYEPWARIAGGLAGGVAAAGKGGASAVKLAAKAAPEETAIFQEKQQLYKALEQAGTRYDGQEFDALSRGLFSALRHRLDPQLSPHGSVVVTKIGQLSGNGYGPSLPEIDEIKKIINEVMPAAAAAKNKNDITVLGFIKKELDNFEANAPLTTNGSVAPDAVKPMADRARELASRLIKAREIKVMKENAKGYLSGEESGARNQTARILKSEKGRFGWSQTELEALRDASQGNLVRNTIGGWGRGGLAKDSRAFLGPSVTGGIGATIGALFGPLGAAAGSVGSVAAATGARKLAAHMTDKSMARAIGAALAGRGVQKQAVSAATQNRQDALIRALLAAESSSQQGR